MARYTSVAKAGFYPTPTHLIVPILRLIGIASGTNFPPKQYTIIDPCCGEGEALFLIRKHIESLNVDNDMNHRSKVELFGCELSKERAERAGQRCWNHDYIVSSNNVLHGDAFNVKFVPFGSLLWLNPPYDTDSEFTRLEERFLRRFTNVLCDRGVLVYIVPFYSLASSAETLARQFDSVQVFRFPESDFVVFKQVVLVGVKRSSTSPNPKLMEQLQAFSVNSNLIPVLPVEPTPLIDLPERESPFQAWSMAPFDVTQVLQESQHWSGIEGIIPSINDRKQFPTATPLRPAHISAGIAAGLLDGLELQSPKKPTLLVKGVFDRNFIDVDERTNKDGEVTGIIQAQAPSLCVLVLNVDSGKLMQLEPIATRTRGLNTIGDLIARYEEPLLRGLQNQCPVGFDPKRDREEVSPRISRRLYRAQAHASTALTNLLRKERAALLLGEIGVGKSSCALAAAANVGSKRTLLMCPPHLLDGWRDQVKAVLPDAQVVVLETPDDVIALSKAQTGQQIIAILSRETAKLGHALEGVGTRCPRCGVELTGDQANVDKQVRLRLRCKTKSRTVGFTEKALIELATALIKTHPNHRVVNSVIHERWARRMLIKYSRKPIELTTSYKEKLVAPFRRTIQLLLPALYTFQTDTIRENYLRVIACLLMAADSPRFTIETCNTLWLGAQLGNDRTLAENAFYLLLIAPVAARLTTLSLWQRYCVVHVGRSGYAPDDWKRLFCIAERPEIDTGWETRLVAPSKDPIDEALEQLNTYAEWGVGNTCNEALFQALPKPKRVALSKYIARYYPKLFDLFIADEAQDYSEEDSAQSHAAHRLCALKIPIIMLTGSLMNGYARSLFLNLWSISAAFRAEYRRDEVERFVENFGYRKQVVEHKKDGKVIVYGSVSDRVVSKRDAGDAPGVLPHAVLKYVLPVAVTLQQSDLDHELPPHHEIVERVPMSSDLRARYLKLQRALLERLKKDAFTPNAGKLLGALAELPSYLDRASEDVCNTSKGIYQVAYPDSHELVESVLGIDAKELLPKEEWYLKTIQRELLEDRRVMLFPWHLNLMPRLARIIKSELGETTITLEAKKVPAGKRQEWINEKVIAKKCRVMLTNPVAVQTGLNCLVWFHTILWSENPACKPLVKRQADGRIHRIGKTKETRSYFPLYEDSIQETMHQLLMQKIAVSESVDGLDPESALVAAGAGENTARLGLSIGKQLYEIMRKAQ